jgi:hypothetical protein
MVSNNDYSRRIGRNPLSFHLVLLCQIMRKFVIPAGKRVSSAMDGELKSIHGDWIPAIHAGMTSLEHRDHLI